MSVKTRDWLKFGTLVAMAFALGLAFASAFRLPTRGEAAVRSVLQDTSRPLPQARAAVDLGDAFASVAEHVKPAVVFIKSERRERVSTRRLPPGFDDFFGSPRRPQIEQGSGSGFIVSQDGYILTNNHVVQGADRVTVRLFDNREFTATTVGTDPNTDLAVIKIQATRLPTVRLGDADSTKIGNWVLAIGNPLGEAFTFTVTAGIVSAKGRGLRELNGSRYAIQDFIQTDAAINPGNSGGPLVNVRGEVIGINAAIASPTGYYDGYGFAIPINLARTVMTQLISTGHVERAVMGVSIRAITPEDAEDARLTEIRGVVVQQRVGFKKPGEIVQVTVVRKGGARKTLPVRLTAAPAAAPEEVSSNDDGGSGRESAPMENTLGISVEPLTAENARDPSLRQVMRSGGGLVVSQVSADGPAYRRLSDASQGYPDIILKVNGVATGSRAELRRALAGVKKGDIVTLTVLYGTGVGGSGKPIPQPRAPNPLLALTPSP